MKYFNNRVFWRVISIFAVLDLCIVLSGCADWESQASTIITLLGPAIQALVAILAAFGAGVSPNVMTDFNNWAQQAQTALVNIKALIASYKTADAGAQPGILSEIQAGLSAITTNLAPIMASLHITDPNSQAKFLAGVQAVTAFVASLVALLPAVTDAVKKGDQKAELALHSKSKEAVKKFKSDFNSNTEFFGKQYTI
jgi:hypothetical protein